MAEEENEATGRLTFRYNTSHLAPTVKVDGGIGGITPQGDLYLSFFTERVPLPLTTSETIVDGRGQGDFKVEYGADPEIPVRDVLVGIVVNASVARKLARWFNEQATKAEEMAAEARAQREKRK